VCRDYVRQRLGIRRGDDRRYRQRPLPAPSAKSNDQWKLEAAKKIWPECRSIAGTIAEVYLNSRAIALTDDIISALPFHAGLKHPSGGIGPAMVALVKRGHDGKPLAIHRTYLAGDGIGKAPVEPQKMMLGPCHGGAVRLAEPSDVLMIGEGIETCLAA